MRLFFALELSDLVKEDLQLLIGKLRPRVRGVRWVEPRAMHLTLRFLGEVEADQLGPLCAAARLAAAEAPSLSLRTDGLGMFPGKGRPKVIWVAVESDEEKLQALQAGLEEALHNARFGRQDHPFSPHLTLGRVEWGADPRRDLEGVQAPPPRRFETGEFLLVESRLGPAGSHYEIRCRFPLGAAHRAARPGGGRA